MPGAAGRQAGPYRHRPEPVGLGSQSAVPWGDPYPGRDLRARRSPRAADPRPRGTTARGTTASRHHGLAAPRLAALLPRGTTASRHHGAVAGPGRAGPAGPVPGLSPAQPGSVIARQSPRRHCRPRLTSPADPADHQSLEAGTRAARTRRCDVRTGRPCLTGRPAAPVPAGLTRAGGPPASRAGAAPASRPRSSIPGPAGQRRPRGGGTGASSAAW